MSQMKKEINAFGNELQSVTGLAQTGIIEIDTEKCYGIAQSCARFRLA
jgi:hypothetical protein